MHGLAPMSMQNFCVYAATVRSLRWSADSVRKYVCAQMFERIGRRMCDYYYWRFVCGSVHMYTMCVPFGFGAHVRHADNAPVRSGARGLLV